jgi:hypothetical protein
MSIFRTVKKLVDCDDCKAMGTDLEGFPCPTCKGTGKVEIVIRANKLAVASAERAINQTLPPAARKAAKARLAPTPEESKKEGYVDEDR